MPQGQQYSTSLGLDIVPILQEGDALPDMYRVYNACRALAVALDTAAGVIGRDPADWSLIKTGALKLQNMTRLYVLFSETVTVGAIINLYNNAGVLNARKAGGAALAGGLGRGFVLANVTSGSYGEVFLGGICQAISGLTPGAIYYLSNGTAGAITGTAPGAGSIQELGYALSANDFWFAPTLYSR